MADLHEGTSIAGRGATMRILKARFRRREAEEHLVVAYLVWDERSSDGLPRIETTPSLRLVSAPHAVLTTLRHLVRLKSPRGFERLGRLPSNLWSFEEVSALPQGWTR